MGKLMGIAVKREKSTRRMDTLEDAEIASEIGVVGDYRGVFSDQRRVIVLSEDQWNHVCKAKLLEVPWEARMANLLIQGMEFHSQDRGKQLTIGEHVALEITGEVGPCSGQGAEWVGGVLCRVIRGGHVKIGDEVILKSKE